MAGRDATFVLCPFSFQPCVGPYVGRARMSDQFGAIACMRSRAHSATRLFYGLPEGGSRLLFLTLPNVTKLFPLVGITLDCTHVPLVQRATNFGAIVCSFKILFILFAVVS